jgi:O-antigen ligase
MLKSHDFLTKTLIAFAFFMPWSRLLNVNTVFIVLILLLFFKTIFNKTFSWNYKDTSISLVVFFLVVFFSVFYSSDFNTGLIEVRVWLFMIIPIGLYSKKTIKEKEFIAIAKSFIAGFLLASLYLLSYALIVYKDNPLPIEKGFFYFTAPLKMHPSYYSLYLIFSFVLFQEFFIKKSKNNRITKYFVWLILLFILLFIRSRVPIIIGVLIVLLSILKDLKRIMIYVTIALLFVLLFYKWSLFIDILSHGRDLSKSIDERLSLWKSSIEVIKNNWMFGVGVGDFQTALDKQNYIMGFDIGVDNRYNSHNQYLQIFASTGIFGFLSFLSIHYYLLRNKLKQKSFVIMSFIIIVSTQMMFESILLMLHGVYFFTFFATLLLKLDIYEE